MLQQLHDPLGEYTTLDLDFDFLELEFTNSYWPMGCCRMKMNGSMLAQALRPKELRLLGFPENEERVMLRECILYRTGEHSLSEDRFSVVSVR